MRLKAAILVTMGVALALSVVASEPAPESSSGTAPQADLHMNFKEGAVSTCVASPLAKKKIILTPRGSDRCKILVRPPMTCVLEGGVIRWEIVNNCRPLDGTSTNPALAISRLERVESDGSTTPVNWLFEVCKPQFDTVEHPARPHVDVLYCDVDTDPEDQNPDPPPVDLYKYDLGGPEVDTLDPWIEVRRGG